MYTIPSLKEYAAQTKNNSKQVQQIPTTSVQQIPKTINKKKLAVGVAAGLGVTALVVGGLLYKHKIDSTKIKNLPEHIDFKCGETLEEAIEFGKKNLGIKKYRGFKEADLDVLNWVNEGLVNVNNVTKGKSAMPRKIVYENLKDAAGGMNCYGTMRINKEEIELTKEFVEDCYKKRNFKDSDKVLKILHSKKNFKYWQKLLPCVIIAEGKQKTLKLRTCSQFSVIYHEMGHLQHAKNIDENIYFALGGLLSKEEITPEAQKLLDLFNSKIDVAKSVSEYAATTPLEFVAECFSKIIDEKTMNKTLLSPEARELYTKLGGVAV